MTVYVGYSEDDTDEEIEVIGEMIATGNQLGLLWRNTSGESIVINRVIDEEIDTIHGFKDTIVLPGQEYAYLTKQQREWIEDQTFTLDKFINEQLTQAAQIEIDKTLFFGSPIGKYQGINVYQYKGEFYLDGKFNTPLTGKLKEGLEQAQDFRERLTPPFYPLPGS